MAGERTLNPADVVAEWVERIRVQIEPFFDFTGDNAAVMVNNYDWTAGVSVLEFLRDIGKHFSVNRMLDREAVAARLAAGGISFTEFSYQVLQSFDYLELHRRYGCTLQTGGSDQWGNITAGVDLIRRAEAVSARARTKREGGVKSPGKPVKPEPPPSGAKERPSSVTGCLGAPASPR